MNSGPSSPIKLRCKNISKLDVPRLELQGVSENMQPSFIPGFVRNDGALIEFNMPS